MNNEMIFNRLKCEMMLKIKLFHCILIYNLYYLKDWYTHVTTFIHIQKVVSGREECVKHFDFCLWY